MTRYGGAGGWTRRRLLMGSGLIVAIAAGAAFWASSIVSLESIEKAIRLRFPGVEQMSTDALAAALDGDAAPLLLDVRTAQEHAVSHLPGARWVAPDDALPSWLLDLPRTTPIVAYCAVGYRSSAYVERLHQAGFTDVANLEGSIFAWANEGRSLIQDDRPVSTVHPFDEQWGRLLDAAKRAELP